MLKFGDFLLRTMIFLGVGLMFAEMHISVQASVNYDSLKNQSNLPDREGLEIINSDPGTESQGQCPVDVFFLIDQTASMGGEISNFQSNAQTIMTSILAVYPNARFGLGAFQDYPVDPYGDPDDLPYELLTDLTINTALFQYYANQLSASGGRDEPESQLPALYQVATGAGHGTYIPAGQQANFRDGATKLIILYTDATFHRTYPTITEPSPPNYYQAVYAVIDLGFAKVLGISSGDNSLYDLREVAIDTGGLAPSGGVDCDGDSINDLHLGDPLVCSVPSDGTGIALAVLNLIDAIQACRLYVPLVILE